LITHTHWDHIQGFPFFAPLFTAGQTWDIYAPGGFDQRLEGALAGQMEYTYFPVTLDQLDATIRYHDLGEGTFTVGPVGTVGTASSGGGVSVVGQYLNHPALALGYRLEADGVVVVYAVDHEPHAGRVLGEHPGPGVHHEDHRHVQFLAGADLVIHDAQYTELEYRAKVGWGHTPIERAVDYALAAGARQLALFHHDPLRDDAALDRLVEIARMRVAASGGRLHVFAAAEGQVVDLYPAEGRVGAAGPPPRAAAPPAVASAPLFPDRTVLIVDDDTDVLSLMTSILRPEGFRLLTAQDADAALALARAETPSVILLDWQMPGRPGLDVARELRADPDPRLREVPVVMITGLASAEHTAAGFEAGVTDYLTKPFTPAHLRARVRAWLLRERHGPDVS
jgi:CheY-like chemotaxis protein